jgi:hypothetical protein
VQYSFSPNAIKNMADSALTSAFGGSILWHHIQLMQCSNYVNIYGKKL